MANTLPLLNVGILNITCIPTHPHQNTTFKRDETVSSRIYGYDNNSPRYSTNRRFPYFFHCGSLRWVNSVYGDLQTKLIRRHDDKKERYFVTLSWTFLLFYVLLRLRIVRLLTIRLEKCSLVIPSCLVYVTQAHRAHTKKRRFSFFQGPQIGLSLKENTYFVRCVSGRTSWRMWYQGQTAGML